MSAYTVWEFRSIDGKQVVTSVRPSHPDDRNYAHEYQRIMWSGLARNAMEAESMAKFPSCSICRRNHGPEITHACE